VTAEPPGPPADESVPRTWFDDLFAEPDEDDVPSAAPVTGRPDNPIDHATGNPTGDPAGHGDPADVAAGPGATLSDDAVDRPPAAEEDAGAAPAETAPPERASRRVVLVGGVAAVLAAGVGGALVGRSHRPTRPAPAAKVHHVAVPAVVAGALGAEQRLLAGVDAALAAGSAGSGGPTDTGVLRQIRADHLAHLTALRGALPRGATQPTPGNSVSPSGSASGTATLRAAESAAAQAAAARANQADGALAPLLASIAACEASHVELLT
jgi:hypothetical protein